MATTLADKPNAENPIPPVNPDKETLDLSSATSTIEPDVDPSSINNPDATSTQHPTSSDSVHTTDVSDWTKTSVASVGSAAGNDVSLASVEKKMRRAERFGIDVQLTEQEKRDSRAERFGTGSPKSETSKASEESKKQARAERFGVPAPSVAASGDAKKKARLARFAPATQTDPLEEEKRKARAIRFSNPESESLSQANGKGITEVKAATEDEAGGGA